MVAPYVLFGLVWVTTSDAFAAWWLGDPARVRDWAFTLDLVFVGISALLLLLLLRSQQKARLKAEQAIMAGDQRLSRMIDDLPMPAFIHSDAGQILATNRIFAEITGYTLEQIPTVDDWNRHAYPSAIAAAKVDVKRVHATQQRYDDGEYSVTTRYGEKKVWQFSSAPLGVDAHGRRLALTMAADITLRKETEWELRRMRTEAERARTAAETANRAKDRFLAQLSHELRTPLTPAVAIVSAAEADPLLPGRLRVEMRLAREGLQLEARIIDDLLDTSRIGRGELKLDRGVVSLHEAIEHAIQISGEALRAKDVRTELHLEAMHHHVHADPTRLQQVFWNLISNAARHVGPGGHLLITTADERSGKDGPNLVRVVFRDDGDGIAAADLQRIFEPFERGPSKHPASLRGMGLGLSLCRSIVQMHGGWISAQSEGPGKGATFCLCLPVAATPAAASKQHVHLPEAVTRGKRILLVEDDPPTRRILARLLKSMGHDVTSADCVAAAVEAANAGHFDLLVSDIGLPDGLGYDIMRKLAGRPGLRGIAVSGFGMDADKAASQAAGFASHLVKPVDVDTLRRAVNAA